MYKPLRRLCFGLCLTALLQTGAAALGEDEQPLPPPADRTVDFVKDIQPVLKKHCYECHGADTQEAGLRLDRKADALLGGDRGDSINPGESAESLLVTYIAGADPDIVMPPEGDLLSSETVGLFRAWIDQGAKWPDGLDESKAAPKLWSTQPVERPRPPAIRNAWIRNDIDRFVLGQLTPKNLQPSPEASREVLIRRLSLDLTGLLPQPEEVDEFVHDNSPDAYEKLVDRLLASQHFGERWGRHWLDRARYADSDGYEKDRPRPNAWRWRDWVIRAVNEDLPFDQFTIEQYAGDLLPEAGPYEHLATAFHRQTLTNTEGGTDQEQFRVEAVFDRVETTGTVWLGLTVGCARCHSHKYDPLTQREYYQLFAFLNNGDESNRKVPRSYDQWAGHAAALAQHQQQLQKLQQQYDDQLKQLQPRLDTLAVDWKPLSASQGQFEMGKTTGPKGTTFQTREDGSVLVGGTSPDKASYTVELKVDTPALRGIRLHALTDESLPSQGPGRTKHGNFVLSEIRLSVQRDPKSKDSQPHPFATASADFSQSNFPPENALRKDSGWAISPQMSKPHQATFEFATPLVGLQGATLKIELDQVYGGTHTLGCFRIEPLFGVPTAFEQAVLADATKRTPAQRQLLLDFAAAQTEATARLQREIQSLEARRPVIAEMDVRIINERTGEARRTTHVFRRGDFLQPLMEVDPGTPAILPPVQARNAAAGPDRLDFARWLVSDENPLTPRVIVNQYWQHLFGVGLVRTMNDFGNRGERPTHPQLLDWLASEFRSHWSRKQILKTIVMSATYRQSSDHRPELQTVDPNNDLLHRQNRFRVEAETVRDITLQVSGLLSRKVGGPSVFPYMSADVAALSYANNFKWNVSSGEDRYRRGMYTFFKRTAPHPNLVVFDCPDANTTCVERRTSNTPLQALTTLNNQTYLEAAAAFARRLQQLPTDDTERLRTAFRMCVSRSASDAELQTVAGLLKQSRQWYQQHPEDVTSLLAEASTETSAKNPPAADKVDAALTDTAAWIATVRVLLNLDEFLTRG